MNNIVGRVIFIIGVVEIIAGCLIGIAFGTTRGGFGQAIFHAQVALVWWISGAFTGMLLIGFSEVIRLLDNINNKLIGNNVPMSYQNTTLSKPKEPSYSNETNETNDSEVRIKQDYIKEIRPSNRKIIEDYLKKNGIVFNEIYPTPFTDYVVVTLYNQYQMIKVSGVKPYILTENNMTEAMKEWFESEYN